MEHESEFIERRTYEDMHAAADAELRVRLKLGGYEVGSAFVSVAGVLPPPATVINIACGLGLRKRATRDDVEKVVAHYSGAGVQRYLIQLHPQAQPAALENWLSNAGLEQTRGEVMFERGRQAPPTVSTSLRVREAKPDDADAFGRIVCDAFEFSEAAVPWMARLVGRPGWHTYMSFEGDEPAGTGALFVENDLAYLIFGATAPKYRGRGSQSAILTTRIAAALDLGCWALAVSTVESIPGVQHHSYNNIEKMGFKPKYVRRNFAPPKSRSLTP